MNCPNCGRPFRWHPYLCPACREPLDGVECCSVYYENRPHDCPAAGHVGPEPWVP